MLKKLLDKYKKLPVTAKATLWFLVCSILQKGVSIMTTPVFTRMMSTEQYGEYSVYNSWLSILTIFTTFRLNYAVFSKGMNKYKDNRDEYTSTMQTVTFLLTAIALAIYLVFKTEINGLIGLSEFVIICMFLELFVTPAIEFWMIRERFEYVYKPVVIVTLLMAVLNAGIGIIAVMLTEDKGTARILTCIGVNVVFGVYYFCYNRVKGKTWFNKEYAKFAITFNLPLILHYASLYIMDQFDKIMIQKMVGVAEVALYSVAYNAGTLMKIVTHSVNNALVPWQYEKLDERNFKRVDDVLFGIFIVVSGIGLCFSAFAPEIMLILGGSKYHEAIYVVPAVAIGFVYSFIYTAYANVELYFDLNKFTMVISLVGAILNIILNYIGIILFGYIAAAYTTLFCFLFFAVAHYFYMLNAIKKKTELTETFNTRRFLILTVFTLAFGLLIMFLYDYMLIRYAIVLAACLIAFIKRRTIIDIVKQFGTGNIVK